MLVFILLLTEAIATVHWPTVARLERYFGVLAALGAYRRVHLARPTHTLFARPSAWLAALGLILEAFGLIELLLLGAECEVCSTIDAGQGLFFETHRMPSSLSICL